MNEQLNLFAQSRREYKIDKPIRLIELFGGIGSQAKALENIGVNFERWRLCEWAIPSIRAYAAIHDGWRGGERKVGRSANGRSPQEDEWRIERLQ